MLKLLVFFKLDDRNKLGLLIIVVVMWFSIMKDIFVFEVILMIKLFLVGFLFNYW